MDWKAPVGVGVLAAGDMLERYMSSLERAAETAARITEQAAETAAQQHAYNALLEAFVKSIQ